MGVCRPDSPIPPSVTFNEFAEKLADLNLCHLVRLFSQRRGLVDATKSPPRALLSRLQIAAALHRMQHRVERAGTQLVAVPGELIDHPLPIKFALGGMVKDVQPDQPLEQLMVLTRVTLTRVMVIAFVVFPAHYRLSISGVVETEYP